MEAEGNDLYTVHFLSDSRSDLTGFLTFMNFFFKPGKGRCFPYLSFFLYNPVHPEECEHSFDGVCW